MGWFGFGKERKQKEEDDGSSLKSKLSSMKEQAADAVDSVQEIFTSDGDDRNDRSSQASTTAAETAITMLSSAQDQAAKFRKQLIKRFKQADDDKQLQYLVAACSGTFVVGLVVGRSSHSVTSSLRRLSQMTDLSTNQIGATAPYLRGRAIKVSDGDTIRFYHAPTLFHTSKLPEDIRKISDITLPIRVCTIDTPETAKFGKSGQPFGEEAKKQLQDFAEGQMIQIQVLTLDQYGRGVAQVRKPRIPWIGNLIPLYQYADEMMLSAGMAEVYRGSGAVYGHKGKDAYIQLEEKAQAKKRGIWSLEDRESAAEYKSRTKGE